MNCSCCRTSWNVFFLPGFSVANFTSGLTILYEHERKTWHSIDLRYNATWSRFRSARSMIYYFSQPCVQAVGKTFHPDHFICSHCGKSIGSEGFNVDRGKPYCEEDYKKLFCVKCSMCRRPIGGGERWVEALGEPWHATCFKCQVRFHVRLHQVSSYQNKMKHNRIAESC